MGPHVDKDTVVKSQVVTGRAASRHEQVFTQMKLSALEPSMDTYASGIKENSALTTCP